MPQPDFAAQRQTMVDSQVRPNDVTMLTIQVAMRAAPRETLCPATKAYLAYADAEVEYAPGLFLMRPREVSKMLQAVRPKAGERALAIAAPYASMVLEAMGLQVVHRADGDLAAPIEGQFDVIVCEGAVCAGAPDGWTQALALDGRLAVAVRDGRVGQLRLYQRGVDGVGSRAVFDAAPPILPGFEAKLGFVF
jgi:protein-L-isoaspartate(D-aspartate) O-methyltransferase